MEQTHGKDVHPRDMHVREGKTAPVTPTLLELAADDDPMALINDLFIDSWRPWIAIYCGDGRWADKVSSAICSYNAGGTDQISVMGSVSTLAKFIRNENRWYHRLRRWFGLDRDGALELLTEQIIFAHEHHNVRGIQVITHPLCGGTKARVVKLVKGAQFVYSSPTKALPELVQVTRRAELRIHREDLDIFSDWVFKRFSFIDAVEYLRATKSRLEPFSHHESANSLQIERMLSEGKLQESDLV